MKRSGAAKACLDPKYECVTTYQTISVIPSWLYLGPIALGFDESLHISLQDTSQHPQARNVTEDRRMSPPVSPMCPELGK